MEATPTEIVEIPDTDLALQAPSHTEILGIAAIGSREPSGRNTVICALRVATFSPENGEGRAILDKVAGHPLAGESMFRMENVETGWRDMFLESIDARRGFGFGRYAVDNLWTSKPSEVMQVLADKLSGSPSPLAHAVMQFKIRTKLPEEAALSRIAPAYCGLYSVWRDESGDDASVRWLRAAMREVDEFSDGFYINEIDAEAQPGKVRKSFSAAAWNRLGNLRRQVDPQSTFEDFFLPG